MRELPGFYNVVIGGGILLSTFLGIAMRLRARRKETTSSPRVDQLLTRYRNAAQQAQQMLKRS